MPSITISNLSWSAPDGHTVLSDISLSFQAERTGIVGRNGVGKSTLLRLISGDLIASRGHVTMDGTVGTLRQMVQISPRDTVADLMGASAA